ncbi:MAG: CDP-alcohol phosphatidyltransferase family protein [Cyanobacteria bacterium J06555_13]
MSFSPSEPEHEIEKSTASFLERQFDAFIAGRVEPLVPQGIQPNQITLVGFGFGLLAAISLYLMSFHWGWVVVVVVALVCNTFADSLDGAVARGRSLTSDRGFFLDHLLDQITFISLFLGVGLSNYAIFGLAVMAAIVSNLHLIIDLFWIQLRNKFPLPLIGPIEVRLSALSLAVLTCFWPGHILTISSLGLGWFDVVNLIAVPLSFIEFCLSALALYRALGSSST